MKGNTLTRATRALLALFTAPVPEPKSTFMPVQITIRKSSTLHPPSHYPRFTQGRFRQPTPKSLAVKRHVRMTALAFPRFMSRLAEQHERDFNPEFKNDVFSTESRILDGVPLDQSIRRKLSNPAAVTFPRVDQFDRFLDYTPYDDPDQGYPDLGVSFPRVRLPGRYTIPPKNEDPIEVLRLTSGVDANYYRSLFKRVVEVRFRTIHMKVGKVTKLRVTVFVGDGNGNAGLGVGENANSRTAARLAYINAYRQMESFYIYDKRTLHSGGNFEYRGYKFNFKARGPGYGKSVHHIFYDLCTAVGIKDIAGKTRGTKNRSTIIRAFFAFLRSQRPPREVARARGVKMADLMHLYYGRPQEL